MQGPFIIATYLVFYFYCVACFALVVFTRAPIDPVIKRILAVFPLIAVAVIAVQQLFPTYLLSGSAAACSLLIIYLYLQNKRLSVDQLTGASNRQEFLSMVSLMNEKGQPFTAVLVSLSELQVHQRQVRPRERRPVPARVRRVPGRCRRRAALPLQRRPVRPDREPRRRQGRECGQDEADATAALSGPAATAPRGAVAHRRALLHRGRGHRRRELPRHRAHARRRGGRAGIRHGGVEETGAEHPLRLHAGHDGGHPPPQRHRRRGARVRPSGTASP